MRALIAILALSVTANAEDLNVTGRVDSAETVVFNEDNVHIDGPMIKAGDRLYLGVTFDRNNSWGTSGDWTYYPASFGASVGDLPMLYDVESGQVAINSSGDIVVDVYFVTYPKGVDYADGGIHANLFKHGPQDFEVWGDFSTDGYFRGSGYLDPYSVWYETEALAVQAVSGATHPIITDPNLSGGTGTQLLATGTGQYITYTVPVSAAGTYMVRTGVKTGPKRGIFSLSIDGVNQGQAQDEYTSTVGYGLRDLGTVTFAGGGNKAFKFLINGKNASRVGYGMGLDFIELISTVRQETESLKVQSITPVPTGTPKAAWSGVFKAPAASGGAGTYFNANAAGNYITYTVPVAKAGTYHVRVGVQTKPNKGKFRLLINGIAQGVVQDEYAASVGYDVRDLGAVFLNAGNQAFKFRVTGKNASSSGYTLAFDYIELVP